MSGFMSQLRQAGRGASAVSCFFLKWFSVWGCFAFRYGCKLLKCLHPGRSEESCKWLQDVMWVLEIESGSQWKSRQGS